MPTATQNPNRNFSDTTETLHQIQEYMPTETQNPYKNFSDTIQRKTL